MTDNAKLSEIAGRIVALKKFSDATGNQTGKSQTALMRDLDPVELSIVASLVNQQLFSTAKDGGHSESA
jgi:hypothetical protein